MTVEAGWGLFAIGMVATVIVFYVALSILPKYFNNNRTEEDEDGN